MKEKQVDGFTLLEMLLVLALASLLILVPTLTVKSWQEKLELADFIHNFESQLLACQQEAVIFGRTHHFVVKGEKTQSIDYHTTATTGKRVFQNLPLSPQVEIKAGGNVVFKGETGNISKLVVLKLKNKKSKELITYQFQMGSGRFVKSITQE